MLFEHPANPEFPAPIFLGKDLCAMAFLGSGFTFARDYVMQPGVPLTLRYGLMVLRGEASLADCNAYYAAWLRPDGPAVPNQHPAR